ncbi:MAG TPA: pentapeptide repeat-containing protein, partial [Candidatus Glassbacteria bacterium]|nr:pentapeptide repeat-containing protein [Candidatus Glassbacteria bacterium]
MNVELNVEQMETEVEASPAPASETAVDEVVPVQDSERLEAPAATTSALQEILEQHRVWLQSNGGAGQQANLCRGIFTGADLTDVNLRDAVLHQAVLKGADLLLTDFQGASLLQADLQGANLLGARFQDANLQGANLEEATGLQGEQLAGANLFGAALPAHISVPAGLQHVRALARMCGWLIVSVAAVSALAWLRIMTTADVQLLTNAPVLPLLGLQNLLPLAPFYLCGPVVMLGLYFAFHLCLQRLWDTAAAQP